jgi:CCR4-NOT transcription complex subunit 2
LNAVDSLFPTFSSPFSDVALVPEPQFNTPSCYVMHPPSLKSEHLGKFQLETLFYMFYSMPRDIFQACAAQELYRRDWRFHAELKLWLKPRLPQELMQSHPSVMFVFFDVAAWETRLFTTARGPGLVASLLTEEEVRVRVPAPTPAS